MKLPQKPPSTREIVQQMSDGTRLEAVLEQMGSWARGDGRYLHWDEMRRRPAPAGFSHEEWWLGVRLGRDQRCRAVPMRDSEGQPFKFGVPDALAETLHQVDRQLGFSLDLPGGAVGPEQRDRYIAATLIEESITSSQLEGASTTREVAKEMLRTGRTPRDTSERMISNNYLAMQRIRELRRQELSPALIFELQALVTKGTMEKEDAAGRFRRADEEIRVIDDRDAAILHVPPPASELPSRLQALCEFANSKTPGFFVHPIVRAIILHFWLAYDHPFVDGNGRTARALFYWLMLRHDYRLFEFISISQILRKAPVRYAEAFLHSETDSNDVTYFILHQAGVIRKAVQALHNYIRRKAAELRELEQRMRTTAGLNHRQQALLAHALREQHARYVIAGHQNAHGVTHQTARTDLFQLVDRGLLTVGREGRIYVFRAVPNLPAKLQEPTRNETTPPDNNRTLPFEDPSIRTRQV
jgi:Fic family protein